MRSNTKDWGKLAPLIGIILGLMVSVSVVMAGDSQAERSRPPSYHYISLGALPLPAGFLFVDPVKVTHKRHVYLAAWSCDAVTCAPSVAVYRKGTITVLNEGYPLTANEHGIVGGSVVSDPVNFIEQAALFDEGKTELIPRLPGEYTSRVTKLTDSGIALVESTDAAFVTTHYLYNKHHKVTPLNFGPENVKNLDVNNDGQVSGTMSLPGKDLAFRLDSSSGTKTVLNPTPTEPWSWGQEINERGDVLGYSFVPGRLERIGVWNRYGNFQTFFVEGTPAFPTVSNKLLWNEEGLIVITNTSRSDLNSYIVPRPNVRLKLADLADALPIWTYIVDVNDNGDLIGFGGSSYFNGQDVFLLERVRGDF